MIKWIAAALVAVSSSAIATAQSSSGLPPGKSLGIPTGRKNGTFAGFIVVKYSPSEAAAIESRAAMATNATPEVDDATFVRRLPNTGWTLWQFPTLLKFDAVKKRFLSDPKALYVQPLNRIYTLWSEPNDYDWGQIETDETVILNFGEQELSFTRLWHLDDISAVGGWSAWPNQWYTASNKPTTSPTIAIIDTGADLTHPDFSNSGGSGPYTSTGGQLLKGNCKQFQFGEVMTSGGSAKDTNGHGTHVAGLALAAGNNQGFSSHGVIGTGYACRGMILRVFDNSGNGSDFDAAGALYYAAEKKANVINLSLGTENYSQLFQDACTFAFQSGSLVVAAGNEDGHGGGDLGPIYPAACSGVLGVSANGPNQIPATSTYSGIGYYVDVAAPGGDLVQGDDYMIIQFVWSTATRGPSSLEDLSNQGAVYPPYTRNYSYLAGTSMACPIVSGAAGTYMGAMGLKTTMWSNLRTYRAIQKSSDGVMGAANGGWEPYQGYGSLNMESLNTATDSRGSTAGGVEGIVYSNGTPVANVAVKAKKIGGTFTFQTTTQADGTYRFDPLPPATYTVTVAPFGQVKSKIAEVQAGCDLTGHDFWCGTYTGDETNPSFGKYEISKITKTSVKTLFWMYDRETGIDSIKFRIGTTSGGTQVMADKEIPWSMTAATFSGLNMTPGQTYYLRATFTNGAGLIGKQTLSFVCPP